MNHLGKLAFFSVGTSLVVASGFIPGIGFVLSIYVSLYVWAVLGFRWWLGSILLGLFASIPSLLNSLTLSTAVGSAASVAVAHASQSTLFNFAIFQSGLLIAYPVILYLNVLQMRKTLFKRLGRRL